jgi:hypothetical protein
MREWGVKDFLSAAGSVVSVIGLLLTILFGGQWIGEIETRIGEVEQREDLSDDVASLKTSIGHLDKQLDRIEGKLDHLRAP